MGKDSNLELKVGAFVLAGFVAFVGFIWYVSDFSVFEEGRVINVSFNFANGVKKSAPVRYAGVDAGLVHDVQIVRQKDSNQTKVNLALWVENDVEIPIDSRIMINQLGILGEKYVEIIPGESNGFIREGALVQGVDPVATEAIAQKMDSLVKKINSTVDGINQGILSTDNQQALSSTLQGIDQIVTNMKSGQGTLGKFVYDENIYTNLEEFTADLKNNPWKLLYKPSEQN